MKYLFLVLLFSVTTQVIGQKELQQYFNIKLAYYGETLTHPGLLLGIEYIPHSSGNYQMILGLDLGGYVHRRNNKSLFTRGKWGQRITAKNGLFVDHFLGLGYLHQFVHGGELFEVLPNGAIVEIPDKGQSRFMPSISLGAGYDFSKKTTKNFSLYLSPELFWKAPFNGYYLTHFALNTGIIIKL